MTQGKDIDYLAVSAYIRAKERMLLGRERIEQMLSAPSERDAVKVLVECGYDTFRPESHDGMERSLTKARIALYSDLEGILPDPRLVDIFRMKYDYHNAKVLLKANAVGQSPQRLLMEGGRYSVALLQDMWSRGNWNEASDIFGQGMVESGESLSATGDPQLADIILDRAFFAEQQQLAEELGSSFVQDYVACTIDLANLKAVVRGLRMGKTSDFMRQVLVEGGTVYTQSLLMADGRNLAALFTGELAQVATVGAELAGVGRGPLTAFERMCDNALVECLSAAKCISFGEAPVMAYLYAREAELVTIRIILSGRLAQLKREVIVERLRDAYV